MEGKLMDFFFYFSQLWIFCSHRWMHLFLLCFMPVFIQMSKNLKIECKAMNIPPNKPSFSRQHCSYPLQIKVILITSVWELIPGMKKGSVQGKRQLPLKACCLWEQFNWWMTQKLQNNSLLCARSSDNTAGRAGWCVDRETGSQHRGWPHMWSAGCRVLQVDFSQPSHGSTQALSFY